METYTIINSNDERLTIEDQSCEGNDKIFNTINDLIMSRTPFSVEFKSETTKDSPKSYVELIDDIHREQRADSSYALRMSIASSVSGNVSLKEMTTKQVNELCDRIYKCLIECDDDWPDIDEVAYRIQRLLDDGEYNEPNDECVAQAFEDCRQ